MNKRVQMMFIGAIVLSCILIAKSLWLDPVGGLYDEAEMYRQFAVETAPIQRPSLLDRWGLITYRAMSVIQEEEDGYTEIMYRSEEVEEDWIMQDITGRYRARVRGYILYVIPVKDVHIEGGIL